MVPNLKIKAQSANCFSQEILHITNDEIQVMFMTVRELRLGSIR